MGFIGSHTCVELIEAGYEPVIVDNLVNSNAEVLDRIEHITGVRPAFLSRTSAIAPPCARSFRRTRSAP